MATSYKLTPQERRRASLERIETREQQRISNLSPILNVMVKAVKTASRSMIRDFGEVGQLQVREKGAGDFVSESDIRAEEALIEALSTARPDYGIIPEERGEISPKNDSQFTWIIDPIDGTTNFIHAIPYFAISVALRHRDEITAAVLFNPITNDLYYAEKGEGLFVMTATGSKRLRIAARTDLKSALVGVNNKEAELMAKLSNKVASFRHFGSNALELASVGAGQVDAVILNGAPIWDIATAYLFIKEAGGKFATVSGKTKLDDLVGGEYIIASNLTLFAKLQKELK